MIDHINVGIISSYHNTVTRALINNVYVPIAALVKKQEWAWLGTYGLYKRIINPATLTNTQKVSGYTTQVVDGISYDEPVITDMTEEEIALEQQLAQDSVIFG